MERDFKEYVKWLEDRDLGKGEHSLENIRRLLEYFDSPQDKIKVIHVAGTNGKGSTCSFLETVLAKKNRVGLFISPFMESITESISINKENIKEEVFMDYIDLFKPVLEVLDKEGYKNTYFEVLTAIMYKYFYDMGVDVAIVEVGLGGTLDSTNVIKSPIASVIVTISMDHVGILGNTLSEIAMNKAGIIKENCPVFLYPKDKELDTLFRNVAKEKNAKYYTYGFYEVNIKEESAFLNCFDFRNYNDVKISLLGHHQIYNAALALMVLDYFKDDFNLSKEDIKSGLFETINTGRLQFISKNPCVLVDGSHNKEAMDALKEAIKLFKYNRLILGFSILKDKDYEYAIKNLSDIADEFIITTVDNKERAFNIDDLEKEVLKVRDNCVKILNRFEAYDYTKEIARDGDLILWCGSLYLVRDIINYELKNKMA